ncbi:hypothetical protein WA577_003258, partial [Blastocystis sp. JDR]
MLGNLSSEVVDAHCFEVIAEQEYFDTAYTFMKYFDQLAESVQAKYISVLLRGARGFVVSSINKSFSEDALPQMKNALYIYIYCLSLLIKKMDAIYDSLVDKEVQLTEKGRKKKRRAVESNIAWGDYLYDSFEIMLFALRGNLKSFFTMGIPDELFLQLFSQSCLTVFGREAVSDNPRLMEVVMNTLASLLSSYPSILPIVSSALLEMLSSLDFVPDRIAHLSQILYERCSGNAELVTDLIREATHQNLGDAAKPTGLVRNL